MCFVPPGDPEARKAIFWSDGGRLYPPLDYSDGKRYTERHVLEIGTNSPETSYHQAPTPQDLGFTGEMCQQCGSANVLRTGTCGTCADCGTSTSCG